jgi:ElaB/YqjD/DUF883 family membrane-anchored ribosome-binding protein
MSMSLPHDLPKSADELKSQAKQAAKVVGEHLSEHANYLRDTASTARYNSEDFIQNNPWQSMAIAAGVGFLVGILVARR